MNTTTLEQTPHPSSLPRRTFRWDCRIDQSESQACDTRLWLASRSQGGRLDPHTPDPLTWSAGLARAVVEALLGMREKRQLERWMLPSLFAALTHLDFTEGMSGRTRRACGSVASRAVEIAPGTVESAVIVRGPSRSYAVALRLEAFRGRWMTTALEIA